MTQLTLYQLSLFSNIKFDTVFNVDRLHSAYGKVGSGISVELSMEMERSGRVLWPNLHSPFITLAETLCNFNDFSIVSIKELDIDFIDPQMLIEVLIVCTVMDTF